MKENLDINYKMTPKQKSQILARGAEAIIYLETQNPSTKSKKSSLSKFPSRVGERFRGRSIAGTNLRARSGERKQYTLKEKINNQKTKDAHYKFVKIRDAPKS